jgi:alkylhydroperoxidase/carboxymuconolactone decarboxylase family protein YurZ
MNELAVAQVKEVVRIDELNLDKECIRLPTEFTKYAFFAAEKRKEMDQAKARLEEVEAELQKEVRANPSNFGIEKITENAISAAVRGMAAYKEAYQAFLDARYEYDKASAVVSALDHKKRSLVLLVELLAMGYFSAPKISERGKQALEEMTKEKVRRRVEE